ncbi:amiloride-sensitive amine oxidase [copper-containing]-like [Stylophora pistillata]|nr:amiloride-sensitive amine oxidase [copper-containing]-like [Stylophora pistillata]XP_022786980.1 amiloride-sensitive amine oxidase [copper-containing]-like [Stylophora pistillata]XP_022786981.1 amiloride-sensitive amine oxidase [copper-containing]-like [Stylophora pistillata]
MESSDPMIKKKASPARSSALTMWKVLAIIFIVISIALLIALIVVATKQQKRAENQRSKPKPTSNTAVTVEPCADGMTSSNAQPKSSSLFEDLTVSEITVVRNYLLKQASMNLTEYSKATVNSNYIYLIQLLPPSKDEVLEHLDNNGAKPERRAIAVVFHGAADPPVVKEYIVYPVSTPTEYKVRKIQGGHKKTVPFNARPFDGVVEYNTLEQTIIREAAQKLNKLMSESYDGYVFPCISGMKCLQFLYTAPMGFTGEDRYTWISFIRGGVAGQYLHPLDLMFLVDHGGADISKWKILKVLYNNQTFDSVDELAAKFENNTVNKIFVPAPKAGADALFSSYERRGDPQPSKPARGPEQYEPDGKRYTVNGRQITYMSWSFDFRMDSNSGIQIYDIKFKGERIVYELSLQEAAATYAGFYPSPSWNNFLDGSWRMGMSSFEMVRGFDCPNTATFFDLVHMIGVANPQTFRNAVCVFELNTGIPLRRHYDNNFYNGYNFYGGMANQVLVLRTVATVYNYDYAFDFIFYQNGVIEVKVSASGYIFGAFYNSDMDPYAYPLHKDFTSGTHDHLLNYKVDLDVGGRGNSYETIEIGIQNITERWFPNRRRVQKVLKRSVKKTEMDAAYKFDFERPMYLNFFNNDKTNRMGVKRGYRIQLDNMLKQLYPEDWMITPMMSWSLYQMAVTKYKENETQSSSIYNQNSPTDPQVDFRNYLVDDEPIVNEDLVAWVTIGAMHVPHAEDLPNTATAANSARFFIRPFNYFDEDPSIGSTNAILMTPIEPYNFTGQKVERYGTPVGPQCIPKKHELDFKGTY